MSAPLITDSRCRLMVSQAVILLVSGPILSLCSGTFIIFNLDLYSNKLYLASLTYKVLEF